MEIEYPKQSSGCEAEHIYCDLIHNSHSSPIFICSFLIKYQALIQPETNPTKRRVSVQEIRPGSILSIHIPIATPMSVGTAIDQPIAPIIPRPNHTPFPFSRLAFILRVSLIPTLSANLFLVLFFNALTIVPQFQKAPCKIQFKFCKNGSCLPLPLI